EWQAVAGGDSFDVPGNSLFRLRVKNLTDYCCSFIS
ncbi:MAG: pyrimidine/purine nucleoside phosphorylase, partial [Deltaproteobacteria bacterium]